jgi:leucyl aminopeptidase (aminopeptidase T)
MAMSDLEPAVRSVIGQCLGVREGEDVLVVVDEGTREIGEALRAEASRAGAEAVLAVMDAREVNGQEPPAAVAAALAAADVFIAPTSRSLSHTRARKAATDNGARGATLPGVTADLLARLMTADMGELQHRGRRGALHLPARLRLPHGSQRPDRRAGRR